MFVLLFAALKVAGQTTGYLRFDTVKIMKQNGTCELYIINKTKDSLGLLTNVGGGLTQFKRPRVLNDSMIIVGNDTLKILGRPGSGGGSGGGLSYIYSATAPTGSDTSKIWIKTPALAGVYDLYTYATYQFSWVRYGWLSVDGFFSSLPPINLVGCGQSNMGGIGAGGDTSYMQGIIAFTSGIVGNGEEFQTTWEQARIGKSPFYGTNNNIAFQVAKNIRRFDNRIVRIIMTYKGGTNLDEWINGGNGHYLLDTLRNRLNRSGIDTIHAFLWHHGESGGITGFTNGGYYVDQRVLYDTLCSSLTKGFFRNYSKYIAGGLGDATDSTMQYNAGSPEGAQRRLNEDGNLNTAWVPSWGLSDIGDDIHFSGTALDTLGFRYYTELIRLPHAPYVEQPKLMYDTLYDKYVVHENLLTDYNGGSPAFRLLGTGISWKNSTYNRIFTIAPVPGSVHVGELVGYTNTVLKMFTVNGKATISDGSYNTIISGNWNITGNPANNVVIANYPTDFSHSGGGDNSVLIGYDVAHSTGFMPYNSVIIGSSAGSGITPIVSGHFITAVGKDAAKSAVCGNCNFFGAKAGENAQGNTLAAFGNDAGAFDATAHVNSSAFGPNTKYNEDSVFVAGNALKRFIIGGTTSLPFLIGAPSNGQYFSWNTANSQFQLTTPAGSDGNGMYGGNGGAGGDGTLPGNTTVAGANNSLTFDDIFAFRVNSDYSVKAKANGTGIYSEAVIGAGNIYEIGFTPTAGTFSKGAGVFIDTNNNVGMGTQPPTTMPLYATGASTFVQGLQSNHGNFYKVSNQTTDFTASLQAYFYTIDATAGNVTVTLPAASTAFGNTMGITYKFQRIDNSGNTVTIQRAGSDTINGGTSFTITTQWTEVRQVQCTSTSTWAQWQ